MIDIIPAIDIIDGRCVRLSKGDYATRKVYDVPVADMARAFADTGVKRIHMVDLDGAKISAPANLALLEDVRRQVDVEIEWGGGISSDKALASVLDAGADYAIIGSIAALDPALFRSWLRGPHGKSMILGADVKDGKIAVKGWQESASMDIDGIVEEFLPDGLRNVICTEISHDGMLSGPATQLYVRLKERFPGICFTVSGGISSMNDIRTLDALGLDKVIAGKAIYEGRITLEDIRKWSLNA